MTVGFSGLFEAVMKAFSSEVVIATAVTAGAQLAASAYTAYEQKKTAQEMLKGRREQQELDDMRVAYTTGKAKAQAAKELRIKVALANSNLAGRGIGVGSSAYSSITAAESNTRGTLGDIDTQEKFNKQQSEINQSVFTADRRAAGREATAGVISSSITGIGSLGLSIAEDIKGQP